MGSGVAGGLVAVREGRGSTSSSSSDDRLDPSARGRAGVATAARRPPHLRMILILVDAAILALGWWTAQVVVAAPAVPLVESAVTVVMVATVGTTVLGAVGLYRRRICSVRRREVARLAVAVALLALPVLLVASRHGAGSATQAAVAAGLVWFAGLVVARGTMREWIKGRRASGDFAAPVVVVAGSAEALARLAHFVSSNAVLGYEVRGLVGPAHSVGPGVPVWLGDMQGIVDHVRSVGATGAVLDGGSLTGDQLNDLTMRLSDAAFHVHVSTGLAGVDSRRVTTSPMADETFLHVAPASLSRRQMHAKRFLDVLVGALGLLLVGPILVVAGIAIWLEDRGPILFRQERVGHGGETFVMYKLRTMATDAEVRLAEVIGDNERDGPLFKMSADPRVTRVGSVLRALSIDELPQLFNAIEGTMSLVGPRPALPSEVEQFDDLLRGRMAVKPGLTGLWQVEARDIESFDLYRRYDLMYVRNWSFLGDLSLLGRTVAVLGIRAGTTLVRSVRSGGHVSLLD